ncbi:family 43 glycosylhydrolase [Bacillus mesophilum]|uniref:Family 43 glycosylhydrolase n=1 Tax=Bacillus mesophilum TaxID=1071718 RepID=A0A7V7UXF7_9BACI|nr:family 43 glycosylhydrolase [Bacillus mesophilum]
MELQTVLGHKPELPGKIEVGLNNGINVLADVIWEDPDEDSINHAGSFEIKGKIEFKEYPNPLIEQRADPYIVRHTDGYYYFTGSYPLYDRIVLRRAKTIEGLQTSEEVVVWEAHEKGVMSEHIWAPELHYINGKWYIHFAAGEKEDVWGIRPYVIETADNNPLEGTWIEKGQVNTNFQSFSLDATTFEHRGKRFLVWAQKVENDTISNLYIAEMENPWRIKGEQVLLSTPELEWEQIGFHVNEGAAMIKRNGKVFIAYSGSETNHHYAMGLLSADEDSDLLDPKSWTKTDEPVFSSSETTSEYGPGHNSFTVAEDGKTDLLVYHARPYKEITGNPLYDHNRHARVQQLLWKTDGTPYFGIPGQTFAERTIEVTARITVKKNS